MDNFRLELVSVIESDTPERLLLLALKSVNCYYSPEIIKVIVKLAQVCRVEFSEKISSAAIGVRNNSVYLWFNRDFIRDNVLTPEALLFVVLHELLHKIKGDIFTHNNSERGKAVSNFAYDLVINKLLCKKYFEKPVDLLNKLYAQKPLPLKLLTHPSFIEKDGIVSGINDRQLAKLACKLFYLVWNTDSSTSQIYEMAYKIFDLIYGKSENPEIIIFLLGDHNGDNPKNKWIDWLLKNIGDFSRRAGYSEYIEEHQIIPDEKKSAEFFRIVLKALSPDSHHLALKEQLLPEMGFIPFPTRKEIFLMQNNFQPLFYPNPVVKKEFDNWCTHIYIDVSGSTSKYWKVLYGLVIALKDIASMPVYCFSNKVEELSLDDMRNGRIKTTGGTDFDCIANHVIENRFKRILIVTDGYGSLSGQLQKELKQKVETFIILTVKEKEDFIHRNNLCKLAGGELKENITWWSLPEIFENV